MVQPFEKPFGNGKLDRGAKGSGGFRAPRTSDVILGWLRSQILDGVYPAGSLLPPERVFANDLGINRHTLRTALTRLEAEGLVTIRQGDGVRVLDFRQCGEVDLLPFLPDTIQDGFVREVLELRRAFAVEAVGLACERATEEQIARLEELARLQASECDMRAFTERDLEFSRVLVEATRNVPMQMFFNTLVRFHRARPDVADARFANMEPHRDGYGAMAAIIRSGDAAAGREAVRAILERLDANFLSAWNAAPRNATGRDRD
jgi:DNA-binding FadR family transcriptional regulator